MDELRDTVAIVNDYRGIARCGIVVDFSAKKYKGLAISDAIVGLQDARYNEVWHLVFCLVRSRATCMLRHVCGFPEVLAGMLHKDLSKATKSYQFFAEVVQAYNDAKARPESCVASMVERCAFSTTALQWAIRFADAGEWKVITPQLQEWLASAFNSMNQTIILENVNRELRDKETRGSTCKRYNKFDKWARAVDTAMLRQYGRRDVEIATAAPVAPTFDDRVFHPTQKDGDDDSIDLVRVTRKMDWLTYNTVSVLDQYAEIQLMMWARRTGSWADLAGAWRSHFVPEGQIVIDRNIKDMIAPVFVVKVLKGVIVCWPLKKAGDHEVELRPGVSELQFFPALDLDGFHVAPWTMPSPLHWHILGRGGRPGFRFPIAPPAVPLMEWQAQQGFARVPEASLRKMVDENGLVDSDPAATTDTKYADKLAMMLTMMVRPLAESVAATALLLKRHLCENDGDVSYMDDISDENIADCVLLGDQKDAKNIVKKRADAEGKRASQATPTKELVANYFPKAAVAVKKAMAKKQAAALEKNTAKNKARFYADVNKSATEAIERELPAGVRLVADEPNGRWMIHHPNFKPKSVSWTMRGSTDGARLVLKFAWEWHSRVTGTEPPPHLELEGV